MNVGAIVVVLAYGTMDDILADRWLEIWLAVNGEDRFLGKNGQRQMPQKLGRSDLSWRELLRWERVSEVYLGRSRLISKS